MILKDRVFSLTFIVKGPVEDDIWTVQFLVHTLLNLTLKYHLHVIQELKTFLQQSLNASGVNNYLFLFINH